MTASYAVRMPSTTLWLVRHGESIANIAATRAEREGLETVPIDIRDADVPLSDTGAEQARALGSWLGAHADGIGAYWSSPYLRARETLAVAAREAGIDAPAVLDERLRDRELGVLDLLTWRGVQARHPEEAVRRARLGKFYHRPPGGESWADVMLRLRSFSRDGFAAREGETLLVAHDAVVMLLIGLLLALPEQELMAFAADHTVLNASVTRLDLVGDRWELTSFSDVEHLRVEGADVTVHPGSPDVEAE
jgi:broad specificity phosphatase PhoE